MAEARAPSSPFSPRKKRWWLRNRFLTLLAILIFIPCFARLWRDAEYSRVGYQIRSRISKSPTPALAGIITSAQARALAGSRPAFQPLETYTIQINKDGVMSRVEDQGSWDNFESKYAFTRGETWFVNRDRMLECQHWLIPWHFKGRVDWNVTSITPIKPSSDATNRMLAFLTQDLGPESRRGKELAAFRAGNDRVEWHDWLAFLMNAGLFASTAYLLITLLRLPWLFHSRYREHRLRKALKNTTCINCNYDLSATRIESGVRTCPECGATNHAAASTT